MLHVYSRSSCHLCDVMIADLQTAQCRRWFEFKVIDIEGDPDLEARFGTRVPVVLAGEVEICSTRFDPAALDAYIDKFQ